MKKSGPTINNYDDINSLLDKKRLENLAKKFKIPGFSASYLNREGKISNMPGGVEANIAGKDVSENSIFCTASLSKPLFSYLVLRLASTNQINLDDYLDTFYENKALKSGKPVSEWVRNEKLKKMTPRMILQHRSGLPIGGPKGDNELQFEPGENYGYSGIGIQCLQEAITAKTGKNIEELAKEYVFDHCEMPKSSFIPTPESPMQNPLQAANSLHTTTNDYAKFILKWMNDTEVEDAFHFEDDFTMQKDPWAVGMKNIVNDSLEIKEIKNDDLNRLGWGLGVGLQKNDDGITAFHSGDATDTRAFVAFNLKDKTAIVYFSNSDNGLALLDKILPKTVGLEQGSNYVFDKYGFERNFKEGWPEREQERLNYINQAFPPNKPFIDSKISDAILPQYKDAKDKALSLTQRREIKDPNIESPSVNSKDKQKPSLEVEIKVLTQLKKIRVNNGKRLRLKNNLRSA